MLYFLLMYVHLAAEAAADATEQAKKLIKLGVRCLFLSFFKNIPFKKLVFCFISFCLRD